MRRMHSRETKLAACRRAESGMETKASITRDLGISPTLLEKWLSQHRAKGDDAFDGSPWREHAKSPESRVRELEAALGRAHLEIDFLNECLGKLSRTQPKGPK